MGGSLDYGAELEQSCYYLHLCYTERHGTPFVIVIGKQFLESWIICQFSDRQPLGSLLRLLLSVTLQTH